MVGSPRTETELVLRAEALAGRSLAEIARAHGVSLAGGGVRTKGKFGAAIERALGASAGSAARPDFPEIGVELKTIPLDEAGRARESTYVCTLPLADADRAEWATSWVRAKLACVLWVPILGEGADRRVGRALLWRPTRAQEAALAADFDDIMGLVGVGRIEDLTARVGRYLQARPKAAHARVRTVAWGPEDERTTALPRGFYLRARFTQAILADPAALP
jgi:DNA mismatch repair protein MutH